MTTKQGTPCWYELGAADIDGAQKFYSTVLGWSVQKAPMPGMDYRLASSGGDMVAGMMASPTNDPPRQWIIYLTVDNADQTAAAVKAAGGKVEVGPADIPGTGRFARLADPQGALFGILQPLPMPADAPNQGGAFDQQKTGHGNWNELMSTDPKAALGFYSKQFGWQASRTVDMGDMGTYQLFSHEGADIGGMMGLGNAPKSSWLPYFGVDNVAATVEIIKGAGGTIVNGPMEVPGPALIVVALDPWQTCFAVVGPKP